MTLSTASISFLAGSSEGRSGLFVWAKGNSPQWVFGTRPPAVAEVSPSGAKPGAGPTNFTVTLVLLMVTDTLWPLWIQGNDFAVKDGLPFRSSLITGARPSKTSSIQRGWSDQQLERRSSCGTAHRTVARRKLDRLGPWVQLLWHRDSHEIKTRGS